tara:strand:- start:2634 stop:3389 length:756 start_codon:yes stop_codon:yes gene_type:complete
MEYLEIINLTIIQFIFFCLVILLASFVRGFSGFGFSASSVSLLSFVLPPKEIVPIILLLEIIASFFMIPSIWKKINWKFVFYLLIGVSVGTPFGVKLLSILKPNMMHLIISVTVLIFASLLLKGYVNKKLNHNLSKFFVGTIAGTVNGFGTLAGLPIALYLLIIAAEPAVIRASLAALFFFTDLYALVLSYFNNILDIKILYRSVPLIFIIPLGVFLGTKLFNESSRENYKKYVLYFLIIVSIFGLFRAFY